MYRETDDAWVATRPILDTPITVPVQRRSGHEMVDAICDTEAVKVCVGVGMAPESALVNEQVVEGGTSEPARDIISRTLKQLSTEAGKRLRAERAYVWQLLYPPQPETPANPSDRRSDPNAALDPDTTRPPR